MIPHTRRIIVLISSCGLTTLVISIFIVFL